MKATILLGTLKTTGLSSTETLCESLADRMERKDIRCELMRKYESDYAGTADRMIERLIQFTGG